MFKWFKREPEGGFIIYQVLTLEFFKLQEIWARPLTCHLSTQLQWVTVSWEFTWFIITNKKTPLSIRYSYNWGSTYLHLHSTILQSSVSSSTLQCLFLPECGNWLWGHAFYLCFPKLNGKKVILKYLAIQSTEWKIWNIPVQHLFSNLPEIIF